MFFIWRFSAFLLNVSLGMKNCREHECDRHVTGFMRSTTLSVRSKGCWEAEPGRETNEALRLSNTYTLTNIFTIE